MYKLLEEKVKQCPLFAQPHHNSMGQELIETTNNEYWAEGKSGKGQNILGQLLMCLRDEQHGSQTMSLSRPRMQTTRENRPSCFVCSETGHVTHRGRWQGPIKCYSCDELGHKVMTETCVFKNQNDFNVSYNVNINCEFNMYEILSEILIPTCPQQNDTNNMCTNDKGVTFLLNKKIIACL